MGRVRAVAVLAGLGMAGYWAGEAAEIRLPPYVTWTSGLLLGAEYVWLAFLMSIGGIAAAQFVWERNRGRGWWKRAILLAAAASSLVPVGIGVGHGSLAGVVAALTVVTGLWSGLGKDRADRSEGMGNILPAMAVALCLQLGLAAVVGERIGAAAALAAFGMWMFLWGRKQKGWVRTKREAERWPMSVRVSGSLAASILLCALAVVHYPSAALKAGPAGKAARREAEAAATPPTQKLGGDASGGDWPGVVLYPEVERHTVLLPPLPNMRRDPFARRRAAPEPVSIPFFGAYWYFRKPNTRPPNGSPIMRGTPEKLRFLSWDALPIQMEARQNLSTFVDLQGCSAIEVAIRNADQYPGTVWMRMLLADTVQLVEWDLGEQPVKSTPRWSPGGGGEPYAEILTFPLEEPRAMARFDEFRVVYRMKDMRWTRSPKIAIQKFVLLPRTGLTGPA